MSNIAVRTELQGIYTYLEYLLETVDNLLDESPNENIYQAAWLSKCLNFEEILTIFQNQFINKRERYNLVLDKTLKDLGNDIDTKLQTAPLEESSNRDNSKDVAIMSHVNAIGSGLADIKNDIQKRTEISNAAFTGLGNEIREIKNYLQQELIPAIIRIQEVNPQVAVEPAVEPVEITEEVIQAELIPVNKTVSSWVDYVDEVKQKMTDQKIDIYEVCKRANITYTSFRKFQRKDLKLTNIVVNKILKLFNISN